MSNQDSAFFRNFALFSAGLAALTILLILIGRYVHHQAVPDQSGQVDRSTVQKTIQPVAVVNTDPNAMSATPAAAVSEAPFGGSLDGQEIYDNVCMACHTTGAGGAPKLVHAEWDARVKQGIDTLYKHAIEGYTGNNGLMPAKGGRADLTDEQVKASVDYMIDHLE
ncbi:MAG: cytochrome c5 family protein [Proteobacteria bacterium]|nr:MAG: cytochrome c5 family protein [Pseudomonadota bacterium]